MATTACAHLRQAMAALDVIAPLALAASWDNVGLLVDTLEPVAARTPLPSSYHILLTNDLTPAVMEEALAATPHPPHLIVSYHPPVFAGLKRFTPGAMASNGASAGVVLAAARAGIAVCSPHSALDAVQGGLNDWLLDVLRAHLPAGATAGTTVAPITPPDRVTPDTPSGVGYGRTMANLSGVSVADVVRATKAGLGLERVQLVLPAAEAAATRAGPAAVWAAAERMSCQHVAVCAGSGASILASHGGGGKVADVLITGEMSHHELLNAASRGHAIILTNHSNSERREGGRVGVGVGSGVERWGCSAPCEGLVVACTGMTSSTAKSQSPR